MVPAPEASIGQSLREVGRRGKYLLLDFGTDTFVVHLMQGGRLKPDPKQTARPKGGLARWTFADGRALLLTEQGTERRAGVWVSVTDGVRDRPPLDDLGPEATEITAEELAERFAGRGRAAALVPARPGAIAGLGRRLANEVCHRAKLSPFASTKLGGSTAPPGGGRHPRRRDRGTGLRADPARHERVGRPPGRRAPPHRAAVPGCGDTVREVTYAKYQVNYCPRARPAARCWPTTPRASS